HRQFQRVLELSKRYPISSTPLFLQFAAGQRDYPCTPWGTPTRTPKGWKGPCYLIEGKYYGSWKEFWGGVDSSYCESRQDPACQNCFMHPGFEPSVVRKLGESPRDVWTMARWNLGACELGAGVRAVPYCPERREAGAVMPGCPGLELKEGTHGDV